MSDRTMRSNGSTPLTIPLMILAIGICVAPFVSAQAGEPGESRLRSRALGVVVGSYTPGPLNAITDVAGVTVGQTTLISGDGPLKPGPRKIFLVHGEEKQALSLAAAIQAEHSQIEVTVPHVGSSHEV